MPAGYLAEVLAAASRRGATAEVTAETVRRTDMVIRNAAVESTVSGVDRQTALRLWCDDREGFVVGPPSLGPQALVDQALMLAFRLPPRGALPPVVRRPALATVQPAASGTEPDGAEVAGTMQTLATLHSEVAQVELRCTQVERAVDVLHWDGLRLSYLATSASLDLRMTARAGSLVGFATGSAHGRRLTDLLAQKLPDLFARVHWRADLLSSAQPLSVTPPVVILDADVAAELIGVLSPSLQLDSVRQQSSWYADRVGTVVAAPAVSLIDDATLPTAPLCAGYDDEGIPTAPTALISSGELRGFLSDRRTAAEAGVTGTASGWRCDDGAPATQASNLYLRVADGHARDLIADSDDCLLVLQTHGMHTSNDITGEFSLGGTGLLVHEGQVGRAVRDFTVAGNVHELLLELDGLGDDLRFTGDSRGSFGSPSLRSRRLIVGR
jgi:PmbA protein